MNFFIAVDCHARAGLAMTWCDDRLAMTVGSVDCRLGDLRIKSEGDIGTGTVVTWKGFTTALLAGDGLLRCARNDGGVSQ